MKIGIRLDGLPFRRVLQEAERLGVSGVEVDAMGDLSPQKLSQTGRRELQHLLRAHNLELTALGCPLRRGLDVAEDQEQRIEHVRQVLSLSYDLGSRVVIVDAGGIPDEADRNSRLREALLALANWADRVGAVLALESHAGQTLRSFLDAFDTESLAVNFDPANLLMAGLDVLESLQALLGRIVHVHARDARLAGAGRHAQEVPLGAGDIEWMSILAQLEGADYRGWLTIKRQSGDNRLADIAAGVAFLRRLVG